MSVKSASRRRELTASSATQFRSRFSSAKSDAYKVHALVRILFAQAVIFNTDGLSAAVVSNGKVELRKLELEADNGANVEVRIGLRPGDRIILSPPANIADGMRVQTS